MNDRQPFAHLLSANARNRPRQFMNYWIVANCSYVALAVGSFVPVWRAAIRKVTKEDVEKSASQAKESITKARPIGGLDESTREAMILNFERLAGTLVFW